MDENSETPIPGSGDKPNEDELAFIRGGLVPVSPRTKARSLSRRRGAHKQPIHIRVDTTDKRLEKLTGTFASPRSPGQLFDRSAQHHAHHSDPIIPSNQPNQVNNGSVSSLDKSLLKSHPYYPETHTLSHGHLAEGVAPSSSHPKMGPLQPARELPPYQSHVTLARRRYQTPPSPLVIGEPCLYRASSSKQIMPVQMNQEPPSTPNERAVAASEYEWDSESVYSDYDNMEACASPLKVPPIWDGRIDHGMGDNPVLHGYCTWKHPSTQVEDVANSSVFEQTHAESSGANLWAGKGVRDITALPRDALYSPLTPFFAHKGAPADKKGSKTMFGQNGWLEKTETNPKKKRDSQSKGIFEGLKRMAKDLATSSRRSGAEEKYMKMYYSIAISLDPREQSLLYCELEFYLSSAIHGYITVQLNHGRLDADTLKRITVAWSHKGRPKVTGFRFDLETQVELIGLHIGEFRFYGRREGNEAQISGLLHKMKANARDMRIRTFCQPDSVIAKQLVDAQSFSNLLGVPDVQQLALQNVAQFFKAIIEREQNRGIRNK